MAFKPNYFGGPSGQYDAEAAFYGRDVLFDGATHISAKGDYVTVEGTENLRRAIIRRLTTRPGEYRLRPNYGAGLGAYAKKKFTPTVKAELEKIVRTQVLLERRMDSVTSVSVTRDDSGAEPVIKVLLVGMALGRRFSPAPFAIPRSS